MRVVGLISGTSYDGIDVAAADLDLRGDTVSLSPLGAVRVEYDEALRHTIAGALPPASTTYADVCRLDTLVGQAFAAAARTGVGQLCEGRADLVVSHGQTMFHWVDDGRVRGTLQVGQPAWIAEAAGLPVVSDLRSRDVALGGQGAPLVSLFDVLLLGDEGEPRSRRGALNLGGIANLTAVGPGAGPVAYDLGPANALIDAAVDRLAGERYDAGGARAARGRVHADLLDALLDEPYYARPAPKSTGKELFNGEYLAEQLAAYGDLPVDDLVATVTELTAQVVARELAARRLDEVFVSGGGVRNDWMMRRIATLSGETCRVRTTDDLGVPADDKEAYAFALLGFLSLHGLSGTVPACTGARAAAVLGSITPGRAPLRLPAPASVAPRRVRVERRT